tara:strand:+ start:196 stop:849 length:654 start_codon:yes stop_codon:yes gene_type:complete
MNREKCTEITIYEKNLLSSIRKLNYFFYPNKNITDFNSKHTQDNIVFYFMLIIFILIILIRVFNDLIEQMNNIERNVARNFLSRCECQKRCTICLDDIISDNNKMITECNHVFHFNCFIQYVCDSNDVEIKCPNCRQYIYSKNRRRENEINRMIHDIIHSRNMDYNIGSITIDQNNTVEVDVDVLENDEDNNTEYDTEESDETSNESSEGVSEEDVD